MAHLRAHDNSKFWYVRFRDLDTGVWREESTHLLRDDAQQTRQAQRIAESKTRMEAQLATQASGAFREWVLVFIRSHYTRESTRRRAEFAWERIAEWLNQEKLRHPREIRFEHARAYLDWRKQSVEHNTALYEVRFLAFILDQARKRALVESNVFVRMGIGRAPAKVKPELSDEQIRAARAAFAGRGWMRIACEIQVFTGCRISETSIAMRDVLFAANDIVITDAKRKDTDKRKRYVVPLHPSLAATLREITTERTLPIVTATMELRYNEVLKAATGATSHSFRITFITRCRDSGMEERNAMALVNHSSREVHAIYARTDSNRLRPAHALIALPLP